MSGNLCIMCANFDIEYDPGDNCPTCGYDHELLPECKKGHFGRYEFNLMSRQVLPSLRELSRKAEGCPDYTPADED